MKFLISTGAPCHVTDCKQLLGGVNIIDPSSIDPSKYGGGPDEKLKELLNISPLLGNFGGRNHPWDAFAFCS